MHADSFIFWIEFYSGEKVPIPHCLLFLTGPAACGWSIKLLSKSSPHKEVEHGLPNCVPKV